MHMQGTMEDHGTLQGSRPTAGRIYKKRKEMADHSKQQACSLHMAYVVTAR